MRMLGPAFVRLFLILDLFLLLVVWITPQMAFIAHAVLVVVFSIFLFRESANRFKTGRITFCVVSLFLCFLAPFVGFFGVAALLQNTGSAVTSSEDEDKYVVGNPMRESADFRLADVEASALRSLGREDFDGVTKAVGLLRNSNSEQTASLLKRIRNKSNAVASLHAGAALSAISVRGEDLISSVSDSVGSSPDYNYRAGSILLSRAMSGTVTSDDKRILLGQAAEYFARNTADRDSCRALAECRISMETEEAPKDFSIHLDQSDDEDRALMERMMAVSGDWKSLRKISSNFLADKNAV